MRIAIVGTGYVGLVTGTCFAEMGNDVVCVDIDERKVATLRSGKLTIFEPGLQVFFERGLREGRLHFTTKLAEAAGDCDAIFLALPTPQGTDGAADISSVDAVAAQLGECISRYVVVVNKSTVPVGTAERVRDIIAASGRRAGIDFDVVSNPEFLKEGVAVDDFMKPERVIIGSQSQRAIDLMRGLYEPFVRSGNPIIVMDERSAEMTKYAANAFLATKVSFMNEIANVCDEIGANVDWIRRGIGADSRIGKLFLYPGIGYGGSCFPKDVSALASISRDNGYTFEILEAVRRVNDRQRLRLYRQVNDYFDADLSGRRIAVWGLSFKPNTDDVREAPALVVIKALVADGADVVAFDPAAMGTARVELGDTISYAEDAYSALEGAEALLVCTEWNEFRAPDMQRVKRLMANHVVFDGRNVYDAADMASRGFTYFSVGRPRFTPQGDSESTPLSLEAASSKP